MFRGVFNAPQRPPVQPAAEQTEFFADGSRLSHLLLRTPYTSTEQGGTSRSSSSDLGTDITDVVEEVNMFFALALTLPTQVSSWRAGPHDSVHPLPQQTGAFFGTSPFLQPKPVTRAQRCASDSAHHSTRSICCAARWDPRTLRVAGCLDASACETFVAGTAS
jgi:hypothetical protein